MLQVLATRTALCNAKDCQLATLACEWVGLRTFGLIASVQALHLNSNIGMVEDWGEEEERDGTDDGKQTRVQIGFAEMGV